MKYRTKLTGKLYIDPKTGKEKIGPIITEDKEFDSNLGAVFYAWGRYYAYEILEGYYDVSWDNFYKEAKDVSLEDVLEFFKDIWQTVYKGNEYSYYNIEEVTGERHAISLIEELVSDVYDPESTTILTIDNLTTRERVLTNSLDLDEYEAQRREFNSGHYKY